MALDEPEAVLRAALDVIDGTTHGLVTAGDVAEWLNDAAPADAERVPVEHVERVLDMLTRLPALVVREDVNWSGAPEPGARVYGVRLTDKPG